MPEWTPLYDFGLAAGIGVMETVFESIDFENMRALRGSQGAWILSNHPGSWDIPVQGYAAQPQVNGAIGLQRIRSE